MRAVSVSMLSQNPIEVLQQNPGLSQLPSSRGARASMWNRRISPVSASGLRSVAPGASMVARALSDRPRAPRRWTPLRIGRPGAVALRC